MEHIAILNPKIKMLEKIISGQKTIESRWYKNKIAPWNRINKGDIVYFKDSSKPVTVKAVIEKIIQFSDLDKIRIEEILNKYSKQIGIEKTNYDNYKDKNYCILIFIKNVQKIEQFNIDKKGFGNASAWLCINNIENLKK